MTENDEQNAYEIVGVGSDATDADIKKGFRQRSLKTHPDRNPHLKDAARLFHELTQAYELLLDPLRRMALDAKLRIQEARKHRYANFDKKRKAMLEELEQAEQADKKAKSAEASKRQKHAQETEQIRDAGRRMVEERQAELLRRQKEAELAERSAQEELDPPPLGEHDTTVRLRYPLAQYSHLTTVDSLHAFMTSTFGPVDKDDIVLSMKPPKKAEHKSPKHATAVVRFGKIADAHAAVCASGRADRGLEHFDIKWVGGSEPAVWSWSERMLKLKQGRKAPGEEKDGGGTPTPSLAGAGTNGVPGGQSADGSQFSSFPSSFSDVPQLSSVPQHSVPGIDFESAVLMRMRQAERARLEREILEKEASEA
ncbi:DnaJ-domain-containing protein [Lactarius deliciosus]|nr:DnaJ-domain-containing protein [Lactarius deliciosus]